MLQELNDRGERPSLLLHSCCGPCSSYVLEYLTRHFDITVFYYNPNIEPQEEYALRLREQRRLVSEMDLQGAPQVIDGPYEPGTFHKAVSGMEGEPEGGARCEKCFRLRLEKTARMARDAGFDFFTTTLTVSPHKNAALINEIGEELADAAGTAYLISDFKKKDGYKRSIELSKQYGLYRQDYCGCIYSRRGQE